MATDSTTSTVLVVDDEVNLAELYSEWLRDTYSVRTAYDGDAALDQLDGSVDVVLLDRRMPGLSGDEVLEAIRDQHHDSQVVMVTAVEPDFDILEMGFDEYLTKPVDGDDLESVVDRMLNRRTYDSLAEELAQLSAKRAAVETEKSPSELENNEEYQALSARIATLVDRIDESIDEFEETDFEAAFREF